MSVRPSWSARALVAALAAALVALPWVTPSFWVYVVTKILVFALLVMALDVVFGYGGMASLGHASYFGVGGYVAALGLTRWGWGFVTIVLVALALGALLGALTGLLTARTEGIYLLLLTLAIGQSLWALAIDQVGLTRGDTGITGITRATVPFGLAGTGGYYYFVLGVVLLGGTALWIFTRSPAGVAVVAARESRSRLEALGYRVWAYRAGAFTVSGMVASLAGVLLAYLQGIVSPDQMYWTLSAETMIMAIVGGAGTLVGPVLGTALILALERVVGSFTERWTFVLGAVFVLSMLFVPTGIVGLFRGRRPRRGTTPGGGAAAAVGQHTEAGA